MTPSGPLHGSQLRTYERIFQHPVSHNLGWRDVFGMFRQLGEVVEESNGNFKITRNGRTLVLPEPRTKDVAETEEVMMLRHFLEESEIPVAGADGTGTNWLLVIDHEEARLFRSDTKGSVPQTMLPHEPDRYFRHAHHSRQFAKGEEKPEPNSYFEPVAKALLLASRILVFGTGTGMSSEMDQFIAWLKTHRPELSKRVVGAIVIDEHHMTEGQLLEKARQLFGAPLLSHT